jgi:hypothetical protein
MEGLYNLLNSIATGLDFDVEFQHGRASDINVFAQRNKSVLIWLLPLTATGTFPNNSNRLFRTYRVELAFYQQDQADATNTQTNQILFTTDKIALKYILDLNEAAATLDDVVDDVTVTNYSQQPFIKYSVHILTGQSVVFNITLPDDFNYCV